MNKSTQHIKRAQRESLLLREISKLFLTIGMEDSRLQQLFVSRIELSADKSTCNVFFYTEQGDALFQELMPILILYKPSLRKALAQSIQSRYTPNIAFKYDAQLEKQLHIERLLNTVKTDEQPE